MPPIFINNDNTDATGGSPTTPTPGVSSSTTTQHGRHQSSSMTTTTTDTIFIHDDRDAIFICDTDALFIDDDDDDTDSLVFVSLFFSFFFSFFSSSAEIKTKNNNLFEEESHSVDHKCQRARASMGRKWSRDRSTGSSTSPKAAQIVHWHARFRRIFGFENLKVPLYRELSALSILVMLMQLQRGSCLLLTRFSRGRLWYAPFSAGRSYNQQLLDEQYVHQLLFESNETLQMRWRRAPNIS
jgi:hypothetical protein